MSEQRDKDLGARLDELDVQEHGPDYWRAVMAKAEPELERLRAAETASSRRPLAAFVERHPTFGGGFKWWATAAVAAVVALFLLLGGLPGGESGRGVLGPQPATAAEAIGYALTALDRYPGIEGAIVSRDRGRRSCRVVEQEGDRLRCRPGRQPADREPQRRGGDGAAGGQGYASSTMRRRAPCGPSRTCRRSSRSSAPIPTAASTTRAGGWRSPGWPPPSPIVRCSMGDGDSPCGECAPT